MESQRLEYVIKVTTAIVTLGFTVSVFIYLYRRGGYPSTDPGFILDSYFIGHFYPYITHYYKLILPHYVAIVLSLHISHSDIAFVVKFKFSEGLRYEGVFVSQPGLSPPSLPPPPPAAAG